MRYVNTKDLLDKKNTWKKPSEYWTDSQCKQDFKEYRNHKCWYSEAPLYGSDMEIDHFRPKGKIKQYIENKGQPNEISHNYNKGIADEGYWWLKNDYTNFRASCTICNQLRKDKVDQPATGGKACYFPLLPNSPHLTVNGNEQELPMLLDPCNEDDVKLLTFEESVPMPASIKQDERDRARVSIKIYHLDAPGLISGRHRVLEAVKQQIESFESGDMTETGLIKCLNKQIDKNAPFSATVIAYIKMRLAKFSNILNQLDLTL